MTRASCQVMAASNSGCEHLYRRPCGCVTRVAFSFLRDDVYGVIILGLRRGAYQFPAAAVAVAAFVLAVRHPDSPVVLALRVQLAHRPTCVGTLPQSCEVRWRFSRCWQTSRPISRRRTRDSAGERIAARRTLPMLCRLIQNCLVLCSWGGAGIRAAESGATL